jgi:hypothetical protein
MGTTEQQAIISNAASLVGGGNKTLKNALVSGELVMRKLYSYPAGFFCHWIILFLELALQHGADQGEILLVDIHRFARKRNSGDLIQESQLLEYSYVVELVV